MRVRLVRLLRRLLPDRGLSPVELLVAALAVLLALAACGPRESDPVVIVDPGPPFGPRPGLRVVGLRSTVDGAVLILECETAR